MLKPVTISPRKTKIPPQDRPAWIPSEITHDWDTNPYAYQTEEELMPAGGPHGRLLAHIMEMVNRVLEERGLMLLLDTFMLYRDAQGKKRRIAPDLLLMPYRAEVPSAYDLDIEPPPPCVVEVTSRKSHMKDLEDNLPLYFGLGIQTYLVIDAITPRGKARPQIELHLWRSIQGGVQKVTADAAGYLTLPEMKLKVQAIGQRIIFEDALTGEVLFDNKEFAAELVAKQEARQAAEEARQVAEEALLAEQKARQTEQKARQMAEAKAAEAYQVIALEMWHKGLDLALIAAVTGLSEMELEELIKREGK